MSQLHCRLSRCSHLGAVRLKRWRACKRKSCILLNCLCKLCRLGGGFSHRERGKGHYKSRLFTERISRLASILGCHKWGFKRWGFKEIRGYLRKKAFFLRFLGFPSSLRTLRKRAKKADFGRLPGRAARHPLSPHLLHPHLRQPNNRPKTCFGRFSESACLSTPWGLSTHNIF